MPRAILSTYWALNYSTLWLPIKRLTRDIEEIHETLDKDGYSLMAFHAAATLSHHCIKKDGTLKRMLRIR